MKELVVPDPRKAPVPPGWFEKVAAPAIKSAKTQEDLDDLESKIRTVLAYIESMDGDKTELLKAWRFVEARRGALLGKSAQGTRTDLSTSNTHVRSSDDMSPMTASRLRKIAANWDDLLEEHVLNETDPKKLTQTHLLRLVTEHTPAQADPRVSDLTSEPVTLLHGDFRERLANLPDGCVDLIVTDPPYPKEDLPLWSDLGELAARVLGKRGILFAWSGQLFLPEVIRRLEDAGLTYGWTFALMLPGSGSRIMGRHMIQGWKPVLAFTVGTWPSGEWADDVLVSEDREKAQYEWQQNAAPARRLIERFSPPNGLIVDPFLGVGSFGVAARDTGRKFIGVELDAARFKKASERIAHGNG